MSTIDPYIGERVADGDCTLAAKIGEGAMGAVYEGLLEVSDIRVAVKVLHRRYALSRDFVERFRREVKVMRSLRHPSTVRIFDDGEMEDGSLYVITELLHGRSLDVALRQDGPWPLDRALSMGLCVAHALEEAHRLGIVHRNLKPANVFLVKQPDGAETPKVLDVGLHHRPARDESGSSSFSAEADIAPAPAFMSPEQSFGEVLDGRADVYSLAMLLYKSLTGLLPYPETGDLDQEVARYLDDPIPLHERAPDRAFPPELWPVLARGFEKLPEDRFTTMMDFADALQPFAAARAT